ncbi:alpha/beta hydrolase [Pseudovibrio brasiliensis]|uniref:Alpha/beta fold hydrolase n=1 Tax=Pseudovibrio brasiliensis TaxID=1898042 RepID=A0ABX8AUS0_9HYPH|nr:alpha/beta hydrolase [Pseudovibrio brasiliensis]QUS58837.1 alpha/beta fold hydrolase [Pseudovibrio brasiliensis]
MLDVKQKEQVVAIPVGDQKIIGTLAGSTSVGAPLLILLHGFHGSRDELEITGTSEGLFARMARVLAEVGYATLRVDFRGSGDSDGAWEDNTFESQTKDAIAVVDWVRAQRNLSFSKLILVGWSQGGYIAGCAAIKRPDLDGIALLAPTVHPRKTFRHLVGEKVRTCAALVDPDHLVSAEFPWGTKIQIKARFFQDLPEVPPVLERSGFVSPMLVVAARHDRVIFPQPTSSEIWLRRHLGAKQLTVLETDHVFGVLEGPDEFDHQLMPALLNWLVSSF